MKQSLSFDETVQGLADYWQVLQDIDPQNVEHAVPPQKGIFYGGSYSVSRALAEARQSLIFDVGCHARMEYRRLGYHEIDLRADTEDYRLERSGILAMMTVPPSGEAFYQRADQIKSLLDRITAGERIDIAKHESENYVFPEQSVVVDTDRALFTAFNGHISGRTMYIQYDRNDSYGLQGKPENALSVHLPSMFRGDGIMLAPAQPA